MGLIMLASASASQATPLVSTYDVPTADSGLADIVAGPDGALWFTQNETFQVGRITTSGQISETAVAPQPYSDPGDGPQTLVVSGGALWLTSDLGSTIYRLTPGSGTLTQFYDDQDDAVSSIAPADTGGVWTTEFGGTLGTDPAAIQRIDPDGTVTPFPASFGQQVYPLPMIAGPGGRLWFADNGESDYLKSVDDAGDTANYLVPSPSTSPWVTSMAFDRAGDLWFTEFRPANGPLPNTGGAIGELKAGAHTPAVTALAGNVAPDSLISGPDGNLWFSWADGIGRLTPSSGRIGFIVLPGYQPSQIAFGSDGNLWFIDRGANQIGRVAVRQLKFTGPAAPRPTLVIGRQTLSTVARHRTLQVRCTVPAAARCTVTASVTAALARSVKIHVPKGAKTVVIASAARSLSHRTTATLALKLAAGVATQFAERHSVTLTVTATSSAPSDAPVTVRRSVTLGG